MCCCQCLLSFVRQFLYSAYHFPCVSQFDATPFYLGISSYLCFLLEKKKQPGEMTQTNKGKDLSSNPRDSVKAFAIMGSMGTSCPPLETGRGHSSGLFMMEPFEYEMVPQAQKVAGSPDGGTIGRQLVCSLCLSFSLCCLSLPAPSLSPWLPRSEHPDSTVTLCHRL